MHGKICDLPPAGGNNFRNRTAINGPLMGMNRTGIGTLAH